MSRTANLLATLAVVMAIPALTSWADDQTGAGPKTGKGDAANAASKEDTPDEPPVFVPPKRGAPLTRAGAATRGVATRGNEDAIPATWTLAPEESGLTIEAQPTLHWYLSGPTASSVEFGVAAEGASAPLFKTLLPGPFTAGIHAVPLSDHGARLAPNVYYHWYVALVVDPDDRARDRVATAGVVYTPATPELTSQLAAAGTARAPYVLAGAGLWYDAIDTLTTSIAASPDDARLYAHRAALLEQVGLLEVAGATRSASATTNAE